MATSVHDLPDWITIDQLCAVLQIERTTAHRMIRRGEIPSRKIGHLRRIPRQWLDDLAAETLSSELSKP